MLSLVNQYIVTLDACVLLPMPLADTLLRLADEPAFYLPRWSRETLNEVHRNLVRWGYTTEHADRRLSKMREAFEDAEVAEYEHLIPAMTNEGEDRHVLAAAVYSGSHAIVTENVKHFPEGALAPYGIELMTGDEFLVNQFHLDSEGVIDKRNAQARKSGRTLMDLLQLLGSRGTPNFAQLASGNAEI